MSKTTMEKELAPVIVAEEIQEAAKALISDEAMDEHTWMEEIEMAGSQLVERVKELVGEGNVRRLIIRGPDDKILLEIPLTAGVAVGGFVTILAPVLAALGAFAALIARVKVQIVRNIDKQSE